MLQALKFVQGAVARKDIVPALTHFRIENGTVRGFNGSIALSSPIDLDLTCSPNARQFIKAIQACEETAQLHLHANGKLVVRSGKFTVYVDCTEDPFPNVKPTGTVVNLPPNFVDVVKLLDPFIAEDASRPWARGLLFRGNAAYATNNVVLVQCWLGEYALPFEVNVPQDTVTELVRIGVSPNQMMIDENSCSFLYEDGRWLRSQVLTTQWPELEPILGGGEYNGAPIPDGLFRALEKLAPFTDDTERVVLCENRVSTVVGEAGASVEVQGVPAGPVFNLAQLRALESVAHEIDFSAYPSPCRFYGHGPMYVRGAIIGQRA